MKNLNIKLICINAVIAGLYFILTCFLQSIAFGPIQIRIGEALAILPCLIPSSYIGLTVGCLLSNLLSPFGVWDIILGTIITLIAGIITSKIKNQYIAPLPPIILNAIFLPLIWYFTGSDALYFYNVLTILLSQSIVIYFIGIPLYYVVRKLLPTLSINLQ